MTYTLFEVETSTVVPLPLCRICRVQPVAFRKNGGGMYGTCGGARGCDSKERLCKRCNTLFKYGDPGTGTKYCSEKCRWWSGSAKAAERSLGDCVLCGQTHRPHRTNICKRCRGLYDRQIGGHHLDTEQALRLMAARKCEFCLEDLPSRKGRLVVNVDHDHLCCPPPPFSCGKCVRGFVCDGCNVFLGYVEKNPRRLNVLNEYLKRYKDIRDIIG